MKQKEEQKKAMAIERTNEWKHWRMNTFGPLHIAGLCPFRGPLFIFLLWSMHGRKLGAEFSGTEKISNDLFLWEKFPFYRQN